MCPPRRAAGREFERRETLDVSLRLSWTPINAAKREAGCASAIRRLQQTGRCGSVGREQEIDTTNLAFYLPARASRLAGNIILLTADGLGTNAIMRGTGAPNPSCGAGRSGSCARA